MRVSSERSLVDRLDLDLDRVRQLLTGAPQHLLAHEFGEHDVLGLVGVLARLEVERAGGQQCHEVLDERRNAGPGVGGHGKISSARSSSAAA